MAVTKLKRTLGLTECIFFGLGSILGAGIYAIIGRVAGFAGNMMWISFSISFLAAFCTAFSYAELSSRYPSAGGEYYYGKVVFGEKIAVGMGLIVAMNGIVSAAAVSIGFAGYLDGLVNITPFIATLGIISLMVLVNITGVKKSSIVNIIFTIIEIGGLIYVIVAATPSIGNVNLLELPPDGLTGLFTGSALCFFAFIGFEEIVKLAEETKNPRKNIPRALIIGSILVILFYLAISIVSVNAVPADQLGESDNPLAAVVRTVYGSAGVMVISIIALFSATNTILSNITGSSRIVMKVSSGRKKFKLFSFISPRFQTPVFALLLIGIISGSLSLIGDIAIVAMISNFFIYITFILINLCAIIIHPNTSKGKTFSPKFTVRGVPVTAVAGILLIVFLLCFNIYGLLSAESIGLDS